MNKTTPKSPVDTIILTLIASLLAVSTLLTVQPIIDVWIPLVQSILSVSILAALVVRVKRDGQFNYSPVMIPLVLLVMMGGASFFLPLILSPPAAFSPA